MNRTLCLLRRLLLALTSATAPAALAQPAPEATLKLYLERATTGLPGRVEVTIGAPDARIDLSGCARLEPFLSPGTRLWGRAWVGIRCAEGSAPTAYFPVQVRISAPAWVASRALAAGAAIGTDEARLEEVELTREPPGALGDLAAVQHKVLARPIAAGQLLRPEHFRARPVLASGDAVRVVYSGSGFAVVTEGRALTGATDGQTVRVQTASGKALTGVARAGRIVEVGL